MPSTGRLQLAALAATLVMLVGAGSASANRLSLSQRTWGATWIEMEEPNLRTERIKIEETFGVTVVCDMSISGTFHSTTMAKVANALIGSVTSASFSGCPATMLRETLPWHVRYRSFTGALPAIAEINLSIVGMAFRMSIGGFECLLRTETSRPGQFKLNRAAEGAVRTMVAEEGATIPAISPCLTSFRFRGTGRFSGPRVTLI